MIANLETYTGFNPEKMALYFQGRDWPVSVTPVNEVKLVKVTKGAPSECGDGRFDELEGRTPNVHGVRILGGINSIMALLTGGDKVGLQRATELLKRFDVSPGTHSAEEGGCGYADLWIQGKLESAMYQYELHEMINNRGSLRVGQRLTEMMRDLGGEHYRLNGNHKEVGVRLNPIRGYTENARDGSRFRIDDWFMADLGLPDSARWFKIAETVEKLKPEAANLEIIVPQVYLLAA